MKVSARWIEFRRLGRRYPPNHARGLLVVLPRLDVALGANVKECAKRRRALSRQPRNIGRVEIHTAVQSKELAAEHFNIWIVRNDGLLTVNKNHVEHLALHASLRAIHSCASRPFVSVQ